MEMNYNPSNKRIFNHFGFFMVRSSTLDYKIYEKINNIVEDELQLENILNELEKINKKDFVLEAILVSSPSLMDSIINYEKKDFKNKKQIINSLKNYLNRMSSRATPYGLMASVGFGEFCEISRESITPKTYFKEVLIDSEWLQRFRTLNCITPHNINRLQIKANPTIQQKVFFASKKCRKLQRNLHRLAAFLLH